MERQDELRMARSKRGIFQRDGLDLDRSTLADWVGKSTALPEPQADAILSHRAARAGGRRDLS